MQRDIQNILDDVVNRIVHRFNPQRIILFGSYANGKPDNNSDVDLLIVMKVEGSTRQAANEIDILMADRLIPMDFLVLTPEQFERQKRIVGTIGRQAAREGKVVYEQAA
jgi:uncharacterized protein